VTLSPTLTVRGDVETVSIGPMWAEMGWIKIDFVVVYSTDLSGKLTKSPTEKAATATAANTPIRASSLIKSKLPRFAMLRSLGVILVEPILIQTKNKNLLHENIKTPAVMGGFCLYKNISMKSKMVLALSGR